jgi:hypothetical protein
MQKLFEDLEMIIMIVICNNGARRYEGRGMGIIAKDLGKTVNISRIKLCREY